MQEAYENRPSWEVETLLLNEVAMLEARREDSEEKEPINPDDTPAPAWVGQLPETES